MESRSGEPLTDKGLIASIQLAPPRRVDYSPMSCGRLYLLGDAAHIIPSMSAKGMNLTLYDAEVLANAVTHYKANNHDSSVLDSYSFHPARRTGR